MTSQQLASRVGLDTDVLNAHTDLMPRHPDNDGLCASTKLDSDVERGENGSTSLSDRIKLLEDRFASISLQQWPPNTTRFVVRALR